MHIIVNRFLPFKGYAAMNVFGILFCRRDAKISNKMLNHESIHTAQMKEMLFIPFYIWYAIEWLIKLPLSWDFYTTYRSISFEREAYTYEKDFEYLEKRRRFEWCRYILSDRQDKASFER